MRATHTCTKTTPQATPQLLFIIMITNKPNQENNQKQPSTK